MSLSSLNQTDLQSGNKDKCSKILLHKSFSKRIYSSTILLTFSNRIYPGTTQILLTIYVNTQLQSQKLHG